MTAMRERFEELLEDFCEEEYHEPNTVKQIYSYWSTEVPKEFCSLTGILGVSGRC